MTRDDLKTMQAWSLQRKIQVTQLRIMEWYEHYQGKVYVSFSGGKDSTVLLDLARRVYPDIEAVFVDTGLEYPEIRQFVKQHDNVTILRPKMRFDEVIKKYGYPVISKTVSDKIQGAKKGTTRYQQICGEFMNPKTGEKSRFNYPQYKYLLEAPFKISGVCCKIMKKQPAHEYSKRSGKMPITAMMAEESDARESAWEKTGCNAFSLKNPQSQPMAFWTEQDVLQYLKITDLAYCSVYGDIIATDGGCDYESTLFPTKLHCTGCQRTGCMFCMFGVHLEKEPNRFQRMKITHPKQYDYCINQLGLGAVLDYINVKY